MSVGFSGVPKHLASSRCGAQSAALQQRQTELNRASGYGRGLLRCLCCEPKKQKRSHVASFNSMGGHESDKTAPPVRTVRRGYLWSL